MDRFGSNVAITDKFRNETGLVMRGERRARRSKAEAMRGSESRTALKLYVVSCGLLLPLVDQR